MDDDTKRRVLVVGGGLAGLTLAAELRRRGAAVVVAERSQRWTDTGFGIGLYRPGSKVFFQHGLGDELLAAGRRIDGYEVSDSYGRLLASLPMSHLSEEVLPFVMAPRTELVRLLAKVCADVPILMGTTVIDIQQDHDVARVTLSDGSVKEVDVVAFCDGRNSDGRQWMAQRPQVVDSGWTYWTWWGPEGVFRPEALVEHCGPGWFLGAYPVPNKCMYGLGIPTDSLDASSNDTDALRECFLATMGPLVRRHPGVRRAVEGAQTFYPWKMRDTVSRRWSNDRVVLCGDAAATSLPTAGTGASLAIACAEVLAEELAPPGELVTALDQYEERCSSYVNSQVRRARTTAKYSFVRSAPTAWMRDRALERYPASKVMASLTETVSHVF